MTFKNIIGTLDGAVTHSQSFFAPYPPGTSRGDYFGGHGSVLAIGQMVCTSPNQMTVELDADGAHVTNTAENEWPMGGTYVLSLDAVGVSAGWQSDDGKILPRVQPWPIVYLNFGSPVEEVEEGLRVGAPIAAAGPVELLQTSFDVPRNLTIHADADITGTIFTVTSTDEYGVKVHEEIDGGVHGKKCHYRNIVVSASAPVPGNVQVGWGPEIGLPCFFGPGAIVLSELQDGEEVETPGVIIPGDQTPASAVTGDVRGTYESEVSPDGSKAFGLLVCIPDPGYRGTAQFVG